MKKIIGFLKRVFGFIKLDYSFLVMLGLFIVLDEISIYVYYLIFIILHELVHLFVAWKRGYLPKKLKLTAFGASLEGFDDFLLSDEIKIVVAGPLFNLLTIVVCYLSFWFWPESFCFLEDVLVANQAILLFNILPIFPLDAGRLLLCLFSMKKGRVRALKIIKNISLIFVVLMFIVSMISFFFTFNFSLGFVSLNLCMLLFSSSNGTSYKREIMLRKKLKRVSCGIKQKVIYVAENYSEKLLLKFIDAEHYFVFVFVDENFNEIKRIDEAFLMKKLGFI